ncbi:putative RNA-binding protein [Fusarium oxysporum f. sp. albedinis]|nr:putative RNA-binding protein [Fusarium oxysporum f. sp. albedinis]
MISDLSSANQGRHQASTSHVNRDALSKVWDASKRHIRVAMDTINSKKYGIRKGLTQFSQCDMTATSSQDRILIWLLSLANCLLHLLVPTMNHFGSKEKFSCDNWVWLSRWTARSRTHHTRELQERRGLGLSAEMPQCKHIMLACCHDSGYAPFLGQFVADKSIEERITLLIGSPAASPIKQLGFKCVTHFRSMFTCVVSQEGTIKPVQGAQAYSYAVPSHQFARLGPIIAKNGRRVDPPLSVEQQLAERVKRLGLCGWLFLRGECRGCSRNHQHPTLSDEEFDALWYISRQGRCFKDQRDVCSDPKCIYGHGSATSG